MKVLFVGTHVNQQNGYSKVLYQLILHLSNNEFSDVNICLYGVQNRKETQIERKLPSNILVYDALLNEATPEDGFNFSMFATFVQINQPDIIFIYNDPFIVCSYLKCLENITVNSKICVYLDLVYPFIKPEYISTINKHTDHIFTFSETWKQICIVEGITCNLSVLDHGLTKIDTSSIDKLNVDLKNHFVILNLNRNQTRKRIDITVKAFCNLLKYYENKDRPLKLILRSLNGAFNIMDIFDRHMKILNCDKNINDHVMFLNDNDCDYGVDDTVIHQLYTISDIGINSAEGEGFGLCNFEHSSYGKPQIVPAIGSFIDLFDNNSAILINPYASYYIDTYRDSIGGQAFLMNDIDLTNAMIKYIEEPDTRSEHGAAARHTVSSDKFNWSVIAKELHHHFNNLLSM
jgi:glycosyltransferase involved in cell wall biosynthesis